MKQQLKHAIKTALDTWDQPDSPEAFALAMMNLRAQFDAPEPKARVIAFAGPAGVGKTTAAKFLTQEPSLGRVKVLSFATPMRAMVATILPLGMKAFTQENKNNPDHGLCGKSPRRLLETIGTEWGKELIGRDIWMEIVANQIHSKDADTYVIDDLRTDEEARYIHDKFGGIVIELERDGVDYLRNHVTAMPISDHLVDHKVKTKRVEDLATLRDILS